MLTFAEEIVLLALDEKEGVITELPHQALNAALAGALLLDLSFLHRIDTDQKSLIVLETAPTGDPLMDLAIADFQGPHAEHGIAYWMNRLAARAGEIKRKALEQLVAKGVLREENRRFLWVFPDRRYPRKEDREVKDIRARLRSAILSDTLPEPRDAALISLLNACRMLPGLFSDEEWPKVQPRVAQLARMELIGQALARAIGEIEFALSAPMML